METPHTELRRLALEADHAEIKWAPSPEQIEELRPKGRAWPTSPINTAVAAVALVALIVAAVLVIATQSGAAPRLATNRDCGIVTVAEGDTVWAVAGANGITLDVIANLNPHIPNLSKVWPGDEIVIRCPAPEVMLAPAASISADELQPARPAPPSPEQLDAWAAERDGERATKTAILAALYRAGARGNALVTLAAITEGESGRRVGAVGDVHLEDATWGPSVGPWQIRTVKADTGTGGMRDIQRASTFDGGARSAVELWHQTIRQGRDPGRPWTAYLNGWHTAHLASYEALATDLGLLS